MSAGLAERIVVYDRSEGSILQCGVLWGVCKKTIRFILLVGSKLFFSPLLSFTPLHVFLRLFPQYRHPGFSLAPALAYASLR